MSHGESSGDGGDGGGGRTVRVVDVWAQNEAAELARIHGLARGFRVAAVATSIDPSSLPTSTLDESYEAVRAAVDGVRSVQLGLALLSYDGDLPPAGCVWRFHLGEERGDANPRRVCEALQTYMHITDGVCATRDGAADVAYLVRHLDGGVLPPRREAFLQRCNVFFRNLYDLRVLAEWRTVVDGDPPLAAGDSFRRFLELVRKWRPAAWPYGYTAFLYGLGAADDANLLYYKKISAENAEKRRLLTEHLLQYNDEEYVYKKLLPVIL